MTQTIVHSFYTLFNGGKPFHVGVYRNKDKTKTVKISFLSNRKEIIKKYKKWKKENPKLSYDEYEKKAKYIYKICKKYNDVKNVRLGKSEKYIHDVLISTSKHNHIHVGKKIIQFKTKNPVKKYVSNMGNSQVPYPYVWDGNYYYLIIENVIIESKNLKNPYVHYYDIHHITPDLSSMYSECFQFKGIREFYIGREQRTLVYKPDVKKWHESEVGTEKMYVKKYGNFQKQKITLQELADVINDYGKKHKLSSLCRKVIL